MEVARVVGVAEDRRLRDDGHVVLERHRGWDRVVDEDLGSDEDALPDPDATAPVQRDPGGGRKWRVAREDVQPALPQRSCDLQSLRLRTHGDVAPQPLEHPARLSPAAAHSMRRNGRYCVRSMAAGCGSWSRWQIVWFRATFCRAIVQRSKD